MKTIEVDDEVWEALARRAHGFGATPNSVLRVLLGLGAAGPANTEHTIAGRALSAGRQGLNRYVEAFARMYRDHADRFPDLERLLNRSRLYLSQDAQKIMSGGIGVHVRQIQGTPYWLMTTIDNNRSGALCPRRCSSSTTRRRRLRRSSPACLNPGREERPAAGQNFHDRYFLTDQCAVGAQSGLDCSWDDDKNLTTWSLLDDAERLRIGDLVNLATSPWKRLGFRQILR